jgi:hypothetical protein
MDVDEHMRRALLPIKTEAATVIAEMRQNKKWADQLGPTVRSFSMHLQWLAERVGSYHVRPLRFLDHVNRVCERERSFSCLSRDLLGQGSTLTLSTLLVNTLTAAGS